MEMSVGRRIYYTGDMANVEGFGVIVERKTSGYGTDVRIAFEDGREMWVSEIAFSETYSGNGSTRFVTARAYTEWKRKKMAEFATK